MMDDWDMHFNEISRWKIEDIRESFDSLIQHMEEDALDKGEMQLLSVLAWRLSYG